jgi:hypothetical protein
MGLKVTVDVEPISRGIWKGHLAPNELGAFGGTSNKYGATSVILLLGPEGIDETPSTLTFDVGQARLLNVGRTSDTLIVSTYEGASSSARATTDGRARSDGDAAFLSELAHQTPSLRKLGEGLLNGVRAQFPGHLTRTGSGMFFVERPDNFWTVTINPRVQSLTITIYGQPDRFNVPGKIFEIKHDRSSYSRFKLVNQSQLLAGIDVIRQAHDLKMLRRRRARGTVNLEALFKD